MTGIPMGIHVTGCHFQLLIEIVGVEPHAEQLLMEPFLQLGSLLMGNHLRQLLQFIQLHGCNLRRCSALYPSYHINAIVAAFPA